MSLRRSVLSLTALTALLAAVPALAQSTSATIRGIVKDETGGLPGASIVARESSGGFSFNATTGAEDRKSVV